MKIYSSMAAIVESVEAVAKDRKSQGSFSFSYRGIDDVMNSLHAAFAKHGVFMGQDLLDHKFEYQDKRIHHLITVKFTFFATDGSSVSSTVMGECIESGDKGVGKAMSYALKTCLLQTFLIPTNDDIKDPDASNGPVNYQAPTPRTAPAPKPKQQQQPVLSIADIKADIISCCEMWDKQLMTSTGKNAAYYIDLVKKVDESDKKEAAVKLAGYQNRITEIIDSIKKAK